MQSVVKRSSGALEEGSRRIKTRALTPDCVWQNSAKVSDFNGALEEGSRGFKDSERTPDAVLLKMLHASKLADPLDQIRTPPPCMQNYAISRETFQRGDGRRVQKVQKCERARK